MDDARLAKHNVFFSVIAAESIKAKFGAKSNFIIFLLNFLLSNKTKCDGKVERLFVSARCSRLKEKQIRFKSRKCIQIGKIVHRSAHER